LTTNCCQIESILHFAGPRSSKFRMIGCELSSHYARARSAKVGAGFAFDRPLIFLIGALEAASIGFADDMICNLDDRLRKKEQGASPAPKIVSTLFSREFGFGVDWRGDAALCASGFLPRLGPPDLRLSASLTPDS